VFIASAYAQILDPEWTQYKAKYGKVYKDSNSESVHYNTFLENMKDIAVHNSLYSLGQVSYYKGVNQYTDMTYEEVKSVAMGFKATTGQLIKFNETGHARLHRPSPLKKALPASVDWRTKGVVTPVKDQGSCGSCWAFSVSGVLEGQHALATKKLVSLSEQNLVDCSKQQGNFGCGGGWPFDSYEYVIRDSEGLDTEASYPYAGVDQTCAYNPSTVGATATAFAILTPDNEAGLQDAVANVGPISVCINANGNFMSYEGGVFDDSTCTSDFDSIDHCVLAVGYGTDSASGKDYWLVKNSWNTSWGDKGYIKMVRNKMNQCAISTLASYPDVKPTL